MFNVRNNQLDFEGNPSVNSGSGTDLDRKLVVIIPLFADICPA